MKKKSGFFNNTAMFRICTKYLYMKYAEYELEMLKNYSTVLCGGTKKVEQSTYPRFSGGSFLRHRESI